VNPNTSAPASWWLIVGVGFVGGGASPGLPLVAAATAKSMGSVVIGLMGGILLLGYTEPYGRRVLEPPGCYGA
jgi:hypothetical protein